MRIVTSEEKPLQGFCSGFKYKVCIVYIIKLKKNIVMLTPILFFINNFVNRP